MWLLEVKSVMEGDCAVVYTLSRRRMDRVLISLLLCNFLLEMDVLETTGAGTCTSSCSLMSLLIVDADGGSACKLTIDFGTLP